MTNCMTCGKGYADGVQTDVYHGAAGAIRLCDECLFKDIRETAPVTAPAISGISEALDEELRLQGIRAFAEFG